MQAHAGDAGVFIRSMATRGHLGGLARATSEAALVLDAAGNDIVHHRDRRRRTGRSRHRPHRRRVDRDARARAPATRCRRSRPASWRLPTSSSSTRPTAKAPTAPSPSIEANLSLQTFGPAEWRPPIVKTEATTGAASPSWSRRIERFRAHTAATQGAPAARARRVPRARAPGRSVHAARRATRARGRRVRRMLDRIAGARVDPYTAVERACWRGADSCAETRSAHESDARSRRHRRGEPRRGAGVLPRRARPRDRGAGGGRHRSACARTSFRPASRRSNCSRRPRADSPIAKFLDEARPRAASHHAARRRHRARRWRS